MKRFFGFIALVALFAAVFAACTTQKPAPSAHAEWAYDAVVYEMNVRQQSAEGTFPAAEERLEMLKELGVDIIWLMPIHPIGELQRKGTLGSYYAIRDYYAINPEFGTMADFEHFLAAAHDMGFRVIIDYVANHTSPDARWTTEKPADWYVRDSLGGLMVQYDWTDISKLNYDNADVRAAMTDVLLFWQKKGVDGFRCDVATEMPSEFWKEAFTKLRAVDPDVYLLAEGEGIRFHEEGFDATYAWELHHIMNDIAQGKKGVAELKEYVARDAKTYPRTAFRLMFTSNHDENSWAGTEFERLGDAAEAMAALTYLLPQGQPLIYTGQEVGFNHRFEFFEKDPVDSWEPNKWTAFYKNMNALRHNNPALAAGERGGEAVWMEGMPDHVLAFTRTAGDNTVLGVFNLSAECAEFVVNGAMAEVAAGSKSGGADLAEGDTITLGPWQYYVMSN